MSTSFYNEILRQYDQKQFKNLRKLNSFKKRIYEEIPRIKEIDDEITELSVSKAIASLSDDNFNLSSYKNIILKLNQEKAFILEKNGYNSNCLELEYSCKLCKDTGFVDGKRCLCLQQEILNHLYDQSNIKSILLEENFQTFSFNYYSDKKIDPTTNLTSLQNMENVVNICKCFIDNFDKQNNNLFFYGEAGVGKTFLTNCIAKELLDNYKSVIYLSSIKLFDTLADANFNASSSPEASIMERNIFDSDLLIIDDLGTELVNSFTVSQLFNCINERLISKKAVIISTNLSIEQLQKTYSERIFSRIISNYTLLKIYGEDIRMKKKLEDCINGK